MASERALSLVATALYLGNRPSELMGTGTPVVALALDEALVVRHSAEMKRRSEEAEKRQKAKRLPGQQLPDGIRYATEADGEPW